MEIYFPAIKCWIPDRLYTRPNEILIKNLRKKKENSNSYVLTFRFKDNYKAHTCTVFALNGNCNEKFL